MYPILRKARSATTDAAKYVRFLWGLRAFLRRRITLDEARAVIRQRMVDREANFLSTVQRGMFGDPASPYHALFRLAGCSFADVEAGVRDHGLEATLERLRDAGVYVTFEEFWASGSPIVRGGREIPVRPGAFDNPFLKSYLRTSTGGSTRKARAVHVGLEHLWARAPQQLVSEWIEGFLGAPHAVWYDGLPGHGPNSMLSRILFDNVPERWFNPTSGRDSRPFLSLQAMRWRAAEITMFAVARSTGARLPSPERVRLDQADVIARWAADALGRHGHCGVKAGLSGAVRISLAAQRLGIDLTGCTLSGGGEPPTPAKVATIRKSGARFVSNYHFQEAGAIGMMCTNPVDENDQHLLMDHLAMITRRRPVPGTDVDVDAFLFTTLLPTARKLMLNVETDDYGVIETRDCGCPWEEFGFKTHVREIRSFRKLTGEGVTLIGTQMVKILEEVLPGRFGGSPLDYQLAEEEDEDGFTKLSLVVSPSVNLEDESEVVRAVLDSLEPGPLRSLWTQAGTLRVVRRDPAWTSRGKLMPLHLARR